MKKEVWKKAGSIVVAAVLTCLLLLPVILYLIIENIKYKIKGASSPSQVLKLNPQETNREQVMQNKGRVHERVPWTEGRRYVVDPRQCSGCGLEPQNLHWFHYRSPDYTWEHLYGRESIYSICPNCNITVDYVLIYMN